MTIMANKKRRSRKVSEQLKDAILNCGKTRYRIAQETGITEATLSKYIHGHHGLAQETVDILAEYLGLRLVADGTKRKGR
jgi:plasmid maintenance system antidote protein VapI